MPYVVFVDIVVVVVVVVVVVAALVMPSVQCCCWWWLCSCCCENSTKAPPTRLKPFLKGIQTNAPAFTGKKSLILFWIWLSTSHLQSAILHVHSFVRISTQLQSNTRLVHNRQSRLDLCNCQFQGQSPIVSLSMNWQLHKSKRLCLLCSTALLRFVHRV